MSGNSWPTQQTEVENTPPQAPRAPTAPGPPPINGSSKIGTEKSTEKEKAVEREKAVQHTKTPQITVNEQAPLKAVRNLKKGSSNVARGPPPKPVPRVASHPNARVTKPSKALVRFPVRPPPQERMRHPPSDSPSDEMEYEPQIALPSEFSQNRGLGIMLDGQTKTSSLKRHLGIDIGSSQISLTRGPILYYITKAQKRYVPYYDCRKPTNAYLVTKLGVNEIKFLQEFRQSNQIIKLLGIDHHGHGLFNIFRSQDLSQIYTHASNLLTDDLIWYIAAEILKGMIFLHDNDIILNGLKCDLVLVNVQDDQCCVQIANVNEFSNAMANKKLQKARDIRFFGTVIYELTHQAPFNEDMTQHNYISVALQEFTFSAIKRTSTLAQLQTVCNFQARNDSAVVAELVSLLDGAILNTFQDHDVVKDSEKFDF